MEKVIVYGSSWWPSCAPAKEFLLVNNVDFEYYDIDEDELAKERFEKLRNDYEIYESVKKAGKVGIPTFVINGKPYINILSRLNEISKILDI